MSDLLEWSLLLVVRTELPSVDPESGIKVSVSDSGDARITQGRKELGQLPFRVQLRELRRSLALPQDANVDGITASYKVVLEVRVLAPEKPATDTTPVSSP